MSNTYNEKKKERDLKTFKNTQKRVPLNWQKDDFENRVKPAIKRSGLPVSTFIKQAVNEKIKRDCLDFEEEKGCIELSQNISILEKFMLSPEEIEKDLDNFCMKHDFDRNSISSDDIPELERLVLSSYNAVCQAFTNAKPENKFSLKYFEIAIKNFDKASAIFNDFLVEHYDMSDKEIESIENMISDIDFDHIEHTLTEQKQLIMKYIPILQSVFAEMFMILRSNNCESNSLSFYMLKLMPISYYSFWDYLSSLKKEHTISQ